MTAALASPAQLNGAFPKLILSKAVASAAKSRQLENGFAAK
jgi:hypothetical protein